MAGNKPDIRVRKNHLSQANLIELPIKVKSRNYEKACYVYLQDKGKPLYLFYTRDIRIVRGAGEIRVTFEAHRKNEERKGVSSPPVNTIICSILDEAGVLIEEATLEVDYIIEP